MTHSAVQRGSVGIRLLDVPLDAADDPRAKQYIVDNLEPGATITRRVEISNTTAGTLHVAVYAGAASISGGAFIGGEGHAVNDLTSWTSIAHTSLEVPAGGVVRDAVTILVPKDVAPGERYGLVWAEVSGAMGSPITQVARVGIRTYLSVGGDNPPPTSFTVDTLTAMRNDEGQPVVLAQVHNTGGRALDLTGTLSLEKVSGAVNVGPYAVVLGTTLAPGQSEPVRVIITDEIVDGPWDATLALKSGLASDTAVARITFPEGVGAAPPTPAQEETSGLPWGVAAALAAGLLALALVILFAVIRRRQRRPN
jgi:hypothetical protein